MNASAGRVFQAFADKELKQRWWFKGPAEGKSDEHTMDFRIGGSESSSGEFHQGVRYTFKTHYFDIVPNERIIYAYEIYKNDDRISVSLATIEIQAISSTQSQLTLTEDGAYLDGFDTMESRQQGTQQLFEALEASLHD
jgi:uncharacterized protein YndB with AHSA1/START domain